MADGPWNLRRECGRTLIRLEGTLDSVTAPAFGRFLESELGPDDRQIVLEAEGLRLISSAGLRELIRLVKRVTPSGGRVVLVGGRELVVEAITIAGLGAFLLADDPAAGASFWRRLRGFVTRS
jgi:anti-anti-sigma factor